MLLSKEIFLLLLYKGNKKDCMIEFLIVLGVLSILFWISFKVTGALFKACIWLFILLSVALVLLASEVLLCCTLILIPIGKRLFGIGCKVLLFV